MTVDKMVNNWLRFDTLASRGPNSSSNLSRKTSKKKCFSNALRHTLVVLEMHWAHRHFYLSIGPTKSGDNTF